jgi:hypothetical protein
MADYFYFGIGTYYRILNSIILNHEKNLIGIIIPIAFLVYNNTFDLKFIFDLGIISSLYLLYKLYKTNKNAI